MFVDKVKVTCKAGNGGDGSIAFRREKFVPNGGPDGGDGGKGGSIIFKATPNMTNLNEFRFKKVFRADDGEMGSGNNKYGKGGKDITILVPVGTIIRNKESGKVVADICDVNSEITLLQGGSGGRGNAKFATSTKQAPRFSETGVKTKEFDFMLELKTLADVGLVGFPNVGKSSLLASVSNAKPKIANYHFTTLTPNIGVVNYYDKSFVMADIPGLIEGASEGVGLGHDFLRHVERTRLLVHVVDISGSENRDPIKDYDAINEELTKYGKCVSDLPQIIALNKIDLLQDKSIIQKFKKHVKNDQIYEISAISNQGTSELIKAIITKLDQLPKENKIAIEEFDIDKRNVNEYQIIKTKEHYFEVSGDLIDEILRGVIFDDLRSNAYFQRKLKEVGIIDALKKHGMVEGDMVKIGELELQYFD